jgi:CheY-like chemotaxis protein
MAVAARLAVATAPEPFDVILLDYRLPDSHGLNLLVDLRQTSPDSAIVFMTAGGYATSAVIEAAIALGACRSLTKPVEVETIGDLILAARDQIRGVCRRLQMRKSRTCKRPRCPPYDDRNDYGRIPSVGSVMTPFPTACTRDNLLVARTMMVEHGVRHLPEGWPSTRGHPWTATSSARLT